MTLLQGESAEIAVRAATACIGAATLRNTRCCGSRPPVSCGQARSRQTAASK